MEFIRDKRLWRPFAATHSCGTNVQYHHAGEQKIPREKRNKELTSLKMVISFVSLVTGHPLLSSMAVLHHVDDYLQRAHFGNCPYC